MTLITEETEPTSNTWGGAIRHHGLGKPLDQYSPVLALTLLRPRPDGRYQILVGVRSPESNRTHPNVASVPTQRIKSSAVARCWIQRLRRSGGASLVMRNDLRGEVSYLLARKLGLADPLEYGHVRFGALKLSAAQGRSVIGETPTGEPLTERLTMFNCSVLLREGADHIPRKTASYDPLVWAEVDDFVAMARTRDAGRLKAGLENSFACAYGLCLQTSLEMLTSIDAFPSTTPDGGRNRCTVPPRPDRSSAVVGGGGGDLVDV